MSTATRQVDAPAWLSDFYAKVAALWGDKAFEGLTGHE